ncbi:MAG: putative membrane protein [Halioglobus sp.]|jgi:uncharacterized membrane protein
MIELIFILALLLCPAIWIYNVLVRDRNQVRAAWSDIDVQVSASREAHKRSLSKDYLHHYFKTNGLLLLPSLLISAFLLMIVGSTGLAVSLATAFFAATFLMHMVFSFLMEAPSRRGRRLMDKLAGFKLYLEVAEKDDLNLRNPPDLTPQLFERYLPYAIALDVEQQWSEKFSEVFERMDAESGASYHPLWYHGNFDAHRINTFSNNIGDDFSSAISSAATPPGSTYGGGGGGFSGGGGGGGGGGGW